MNTKLDYLFRVESPWIYVGSAEPERKKWNPQHFYARTSVNACARLLRGHKMRTRDALMNEFGAALQFFEGFGENWPALGECLECLDEWMPAAAYVLTVERAEEVLQDEQPLQMEALLKTLHDAGEWWAKPISNNDRFNRDAIPFHVLLNVTDGFSTENDRIVRLAEASHVPIRQ